MTLANLRPRAVQPRPSHASIVPEYQAAWFAGHDQIVGAIRRYLTVSPEQCESLVDIGAGDGSVLDDLASRLPQFKLLVGIVVDPRALRLASARSHHDSRLLFELGNPWAWLRSQDRPGTITFSYDNLSILPEDCLLDWFSELRENGISGVALAEPQTGGCAKLPSLLRQCGGTIRYESNPCLDGQAWWHVFASFERGRTTIEAHA